MLLLSPEEIARLTPAEELPLRTPIPTRMVSNGEFTPGPQTELQKKFERRLLELADLGRRRHGLSRRKFFASGMGMATGFLAMNDVYGQVFNIPKAETIDPMVLQERTKALAGQFIFDDQVHFIRDDLSPKSAARVNRQLGWRRYAQKHLNPGILEPGPVQHLQFSNFIREVYFDSDTKVSLLSGAPADEDHNSFLRNEQIYAAREAVNALSASRRMFSHVIFRPGAPGWMEDLQTSLQAFKTDSVKGYTVGDPFAPSKISVALGR